jgi:antitoxin CcdA
MASMPACERKRPVNETLSEALIAQVKAHSNNLSATIASSLSAFVNDQQKLQADRQRAADACAEDWNAVHAAVGSFTDEHSTL